MKSSNINKVSIINTKQQYQSKGMNNKGISTIIITNIDNKQQSYIHNKEDLQIYKFNHQSLQYPSQLIALNTINDIFNKVKQKVFQNHTIRMKLNPYGNKFSQIYTNQIIQLSINNQSLLLPFQQDNQPQPLKSDNLIPIGTNIQQKISPISQNYQLLSKKQSFNQSIKGKFPRNSSIISKISKQTNTLNNTQSNLNNNKIIPKIQSYIKLKQQDLPKLQLSFDPFIESLRKQKQTQLLQNQSIKKIQKKTNLIDIIKKDQKISYDFNGEIIKIKNNLKPNFIQNSVEGSQNSALTKKQKQVKNDSNPINLDINSKKGFDNKKALSKKTMDIQFSNIVSLTPQLDIHEGVKFIQGKNVMEKKKKQPSINDLKKTISNKKLSRIDFERLKSLGDNKSIRAKGQRPSLPTILKSQTDVNIERISSILGRSMSEAKFDGSLQKYSVKNKQFLTDRSQDRMSIQNEQLTQMLIQPVHNSLEDALILRLPTNENQVSSKIQQLSQMDRANLNFIKTGAVSKLQFPKISYRIVNRKLNTKNEHCITLLQQKSKLKGKRKQNEFERLRKHFEDKLRI